MSLDHREISEGQTLVTYLRIAQAQVLVTFWDS